METTRLEQWDAILGVDHLDWLLLGAIVVSVSGSRHGGLGMVESLVLFQVGETQRATGKCLSVLQPRNTCELNSSGCLSSVTDVHLGRAER